jgi:hypothetical protein
MPKMISTSPKKDRRLAVSLLLLLTFSLLPLVSIAANDVISPGAIWRDTDGRVIQAHGGGILQHEGKYYWYGENRTPRKPTTVSCYSSTNLHAWKSEGVVFGPEDFPAEMRGTFIERPKVLFNSKTRQFVMWWHADTNDYGLSQAGIAVADKPTGPFKYLRSFRPINDQGFRDMNLFLDDDGSAYVFYASERNLANYVSKLNADFTDVERPPVQGRTWERNFAGTRREAAAPFKHGGKYYLITSGATGWNPNAADLSVADRPIGPYKPLGNPCVGPDANKTFLAQSTFVLPAPNKPGTFIFMADQWSPKDLGDSRYIWLPFTVEAGKPIQIHWRYSWSFSQLR